MVYNISVTPNTKVPNSSEIDQALKEFEAGADAEKMQNSPEVSKISEMQKEDVSGVKFETDSWKAVKFYGETNTPKIVKLVMKYSGGAIKEQKTAEYVLLGIVILMFAVSFYLFFGGGGSGSPRLSNEELERMNRLMLGL